MDKDRYVFTTEQEYTNKKGKICLRIKEMQFFDSIDLAVHFLVFGRYERLDYRWSIYDRNEQDVITEGNFNQYGAVVIHSWKEDNVQLWNSTNQRNKQYV